MKTQFLILFTFLFSISNIQAQKKVFPFEKDEKWGIVNEKNKQVFPPTYDRISFFINHDKKGAFALFLKDYKWGLIDARGEIILPADYDKIAYLYGGKMVRVAKEGKFGGYDIGERKFIVPIEYSRNLAALDKRGNYYQIQKGNEISVIDLKGNTIIPIDTQNISILTPSSSCPIFRIINNEKKQYVNCQGKEVEKVNRETGDQSLNEIKLDNPKRGGWNDKSLEAQAIRKRVSEVHQDSLEFVRFAVNSSIEYFAVVHKDGKWGMTDSTGKICLPVKYDKIQKEKYYGYQFFSGYVWGLFDLEQGKILLDAKYWQIYDGPQYLQYIPKAKGYFFVRTPDKIGGCVDKTTGVRYVP